MGSINQVPSSQVLGFLQARFYWFGEAKFCGSVKPSFGVPSSQVLGSLQARFYWFGEAKFCGPVELPSSKN